MPPSKEEEEAAKNTFACTAAGERLVIRFDVGEARLLMPDGNRVSLYQIPADLRRALFQRQHRAARQGHGLASSCATASPTQLKDCQPFSRRRSDGADDRPAASRRRHRHRRDGRRRRARASFAPASRRRRGTSAPKRRRARSAMAQRLRDSPAELARACDVVIVLVVDADQVETVLFGADGVATARSARLASCSCRRPSIRPT